MVYQYIAYTESGEIVKGKLAAANEEAATDLLGYAGYQAINLKPFVPLLSLDKLLASLHPPKPNEIILFYRELAMLLESGIDIISSLELLQSQASNRTLKRALREVTADLRGGNQLSASLGKHPEAFPQMYHRLLSVGEQSGGLEIILGQIADYMEKEVATAKSVKNALMYPVITFIVTIVVTGLLVTFVLPSFAKIYTSIGVDLPPLVTTIITAASKIKSYGIHILLAILAAAGAVFTYGKTQDGRYRRDKLVLSLPLVGRVNHLSELARCCRNMSLLFHAGLPLIEVLALVIQGCNNKVIAKALTDVQQDMAKGEGISQPMAKNNIFLPLMVQMVKVGEETGNLDTTLLAVSRSYEAEAEDKTRSLIALIQPVMTLIIGLIVGLIALSLTSAMYSIYGQEF